MYTALYTLCSGIIDRPEFSMSMSVQSVSLSALQLHVYGKSITNQRIEALWSKLRAHILHWRNFFAYLINNGDFEPGNDVHTGCARFCFRALIQQTLDRFTSNWNSHRIHVRARNVLLASLMSYFILGKPTV
jgi:hypothetical protein